VAIVMHCNLRPSDVAAAVVGSNNALQIHSIPHSLWSRNAPAHHILAQSDNPRLSY